MSARNSEFPTQNIVVANGSTFIGLQLSHEQLKDATNVLYLHLRKDNRRCYVGITVLPVLKRWRYGFGYGENMLLGRAINRHGWNAFDHIVLAFANNREQLLDAEVRAIEAAGGHRTRYTYNLSPGGEVVGRIGRPIIGVHLPTGEMTAFKSGLEAAKELGFSSVDMPNAVARKELTSLHDWWFRFADDEEAKPPELWGEKLRLARLIDRRGRHIIGVNLETGEERRFRTSAVAARALGLSSVTRTSRARCRSHGERLQRERNETVPCSPSTLRLASAAPSEIARLLIKSCRSTGALQLQSHRRKGLQRVGGGSHTTRQSRAPNSTSRHLSRSIVRKPW
jgi:hypothetical protein